MAEDVLSFGVAGSTTCDLAYLIVYFVCLLILVTCQLYSSYYHALFDSVQSHINL